MFMDRIKGAGWDTQHTPPAAAHIQEVSLIFGKSTKSISATRFIGQAFRTCPAQLIINFQHYISSAFHICDYIQRKENY